MAQRTIQSPGVEIRESDLSLTAPANIGTNMYVTGFAQQGPIDEILNITTKQELLQIFGPPTNSAERYFHYTISQLLNSPATVYAGRLPYGSGEGDGFGSKYSALAYPVTAANTDGLLNSLSQSGSAVYILGEPVHLTLTESQYLGAVDGSAVTWSPSGNTQTLIATPSDIGRAGIVVLNKAQVTNNNQNEGYYVGLVDNTNSNPGSNFVSLTAAKSITSDAVCTNPSSLTDLPHGTLTFDLSANYLTGTSNSISEVVENLTDYDLGTRSFDDYLGVGIFKLRKSTFANEATKLDYVLTDGVVGSINSHRMQLNPQSGPEVTAFIGNRFEDSRNVTVLVNDYISNRLTGGNALNDDGTPKKRIRIAGNTLNNATSAAVGFNYSKDLATAVTMMGGSDVNNLYPLGAYTDQTVTDKILGNIPNKLERALDGIRNDEIYDIDVVVEGGLGTIHSVACAAATNYYDEFSYDGKISTAVDGLRTSSDLSVASAITLRNNYATIFNKFEQFVKPPYEGGSRGDCIFIADPIRQIFIKGENTKTLSDSTKNFQTDVYWATRHQFENENTSYAATYGSWAQVNDGYSGQNVWVPFSPFAAAAMARTDAATFPWFAPAGFTRGLVTDAIDIAVNPNQKQRDEFYKANINPVAFFPAQGQVIFGQKTLQKKPSAFDRINVRRLFLALERPTKKVSRFFVFEQNTEFTRTRIVNTLTPLFERAKNNEGLYDYLIVCDERNNTPAVIDANELVVDIYIKPTRTAEFILVNFYATRTDANFQELVGG